MKNVIAAEEEKERRASRKRGEETKRLNKCTRRRIRRRAAGVKSKQGGRGMAGKYIPPFVKKCPYEWQNGRESFAPFPYNILTVNGAFMVSGRAQMYVSTFLRLFTSRLPLVTKWSAVKSAASAVSAPRVKEKEGAAREGGREGEEGQRWRAPFYSPRCGRGVSSSRTKTD